jgi:L-fuculose-phosphate aldolase
MAGALPLHAPLQWTAAVGVKHSGRHLHPGSPASSFGGLKHDMSASPAPDDAAARREVIEVMRALSARGLNRGTAGNVSIRRGSGMLITPSGIDAAELAEADIVAVDAAGRWPAGGLKPSSEWQMHQQLLARRPDAMAVVHCHSRHATILACAGRPIPAVHYMVGIAGGASVPLAPYEPFGSHELADGVADTMAGGWACLMANHGLVTLGTSLSHALLVAEQIEEQAAVYFGTLLIGGPTLLSAPQMADVLQRLASYGQNRS